METSSTIVEFAPQRQIQSLLKELAPQATYVGTDLMDLRFASLAADGCALPFPDSSVDLIISFHVLEHIPDDGLAMRELARVTKPGGLIILQVPRREGAPTDEDPNASPEERTLRFGQDDHVRFYGDDLEARLESAGLRTTSYTAADLLEPQQQDRWGVPADNPIWICRP